MKEQMIEKEISITIDREQTIQNAETAGSLRQTLNSLEDEFEDVKKKFKSEKGRLTNLIDENSTEIKKLLDEINTGKSLKVLPVRMVSNFDTCMIEYWYPRVGPTSAKVEERPMEANERQLTLLETEAAAVSESGSSLGED